VLTVFVMNTTGGDYLHQVGTTGDGFLVLEDQVILLWIVQGDHFKEGPSAEAEREAACIVLFPGCSHLQSCSREQLH